MNTKIGQQKKIRTEANVMIGYGYYVKITTARNVIPQQSEWNQVMTVKCNKSFSRPNGRQHAHQHVHLMVQMHILRMCEI